MTKRKKKTTFYDLLKDYLNSPKMLEDLKRAYKAQEEYKAQGKELVIEKVIKSMKHWNK